MKSLLHGGGYGWSGWGTEGTGLRRWDHPPPLPHPPLPQPQKSGDQGQHLDSSWEVTGGGAPLPNAEAIRQPGQDR